MLSYVFNILEQEKYEEVGSEEFDFIGDLFAELLYRAVSNQLKRGLAKEYILKNEAVHGVKGKLKITESIKRLSMIEKRMVCEFDDFSENIYLNQIIKATVSLLISSKNIDKKYKSKLRKSMLFFDNVDLIDYKSINFNKVHINRSNKTYELLINLCYLIINGLIIDDKTNGLIMRKHINNEQMYNLFEKFILKYYIKHYPELNPSTTRVQWITNRQNSSIELLPNMITDIVLYGTNKTLIIDTKYYQKVLSGQYEIKKYRSDHVYQMYAYVSTMQLTYDEEIGMSSNNVSGMLLYAKTDTVDSLDENVNINNVNITFKTLDLNTDFLYIKKELNDIASRV